MEDQVESKCMVEVDDEDRPEIRRLREIEEARSDVDRAERTMKECQALYQASKKTFDAAVVKFRNAGRELPLLDRIGDDDESWRKTPLAEMGIKPGLLKKLAEHGFESLGQLSDWAEAGNQLSDITGIGESGAEQIQVACDNFWESRNVDGSM